MLLFNIINFGIFMIYYLQFYFFTDDLGKFFDFIYITGKYE
jgi:hypothetical protein